MCSLVMDVRFVSRGVVLAIEAGEVYFLPDIPVSDYASPRSGSCGRSSLLDRPNHDEKCEVV